MTAEIVAFPVKTAPTGNGAREALIAIEVTPNATGLTWSDWLLAELWLRGFKVVPLDGVDDLWPAP
jgi:hypothetical protein